MRFGGRQNADSESFGEMARLAQSPGTEKADLVRGAVQALLAASDVDRAGVWIDEGEIDSRSPRGWPVLRGLVSDRSGEDAPSDWARLSLEALPSLEPLITGRSIQQDLDGTRDQLMLGALLELQRAVWAPVGARGQFRGVVLAGTRRKRGQLPLAQVEAISAELSLAIELEEERRLARQRQADINATSRLLSELTSSGPIDSIFTRLVDGCTETAPAGDGLGAIFAILRIRSEFISNVAPSARQPVSQRNGRWSIASSSAGRNGATPCWQSGDAAWLHAMDRSPLVSIWQRAADARNTIVVGSGSGLPWPRADVSRILAVPLFASREPVGTLVAGLRSGPATQRDVERLEFRGELAAAALAQRQSAAALVLERKRQQAIVESDSSAKIILESGGRLGAMSSGAQELLGRSASEKSTSEKSESARPATIHGIVSSAGSAEGRSMASARPIVAPKLSRSQRRSTGSALTHRRDSPASSDSVR